MKKILATMAVAALAAWAAPASAGVIHSDPGGLLVKNGSPIIVNFDASAFSNVKLTFETDGIGGNDPCNGTFDCFTVKLNGVALAGFDGIGVSRSPDDHGPILLGDNLNISLEFSSTFSSSSEKIQISNIQLKNKIVSEPAPLALFGLGLAGLGYMRRKRSS